MKFSDVVKQAIALVQESGQISYRALKIEFDLGDDRLDALKEELLYSNPNIVDDEGRGLIWNSEIDLTIAPVDSHFPPRSRTPVSYTPPHLAEKILKFRSVLEGERKEVTVMFADVKGSMELTEQLDAEVWHQILERFFLLLTEGVHRHEGTINQYTGDGVMALFGAPVAHEDHAQRACYAALNLRDLLREFSHEIKHQYDVDFATRIGLNSGEVVVGKIGDDLRMDYTAQGHTVGLAQRMESLAASGSIYLAPPTAALVQGYFSLANRGEFSVKGLSQPLSIFELVGIDQERSRFDVARFHGLSRFVGRTADLRTLEDVLTQVTDGNGQVVGVVAEAGAGKSRLCYEFLAQARARGLTVVDVRAVAHGRNIPLLPILELFRGYLGVTALDDNQEAREKIIAKTILFDQTFTDAVALLLDFLGVTDPKHPAPKLGAPEVRQRQLIALMQELIRSASKQQPTIILIENLHWLDDASSEFLEQLVDANIDNRCLLLLNFRPEYHAQWMQKSGYRQIPLTSLGYEAIKELLADQLGSDISLIELSESIHARTAGNPFFTEEVVQSLIEKDHLQGIRGAYRLVTPIEHFGVPATVQALLAARIDRLPEREKQLLQVASVIGKDFPEPLLADVAGMPEDERRAALSTLRHAEFILEQSVYPVAIYTFKHPLTQEVALGSQLREKRHLIHTAVAAAIERQDADNLDERAALLAHHWEEAGDALSAARWHRRAAEWVANTDFAAATCHWQRVRVLLEELPIDRETATLGISACTHLLSMNLSVKTGLDEARSLLEEGQALADRIGDQRAHLNLAQAYGFALNSAGDMVGYLELTIENQGAALKIDDIGVQANASMYLVDALGHAGRLPEALEVAEDGLERLPRDLPVSEWTGGINPYTMCSIWRGICLCWMGRVPKGLEELDRCSRLAEEDGTSEMRGYALMLAAEVYYRVHDAEQALDKARQVEEINRKLDEPANLVALTQLAYGYAHLAAGRAVDAIEPARSALHLHGSVENEMTGWSSTLLAEALLAAGDLSGAKAAAEEAIMLCQLSQRALFEAVGHGILARALLRCEGIAARTAIELALDNAKQLIDRTGARSLAIALLEWRAELAKALGEETASEELLREAEQGYEEIGAANQVRRLVAERQVA
ncbi:MAG: adenylate/guanylate cyclase domain-containing protein [Candidatus Reddybacter sp.]